jgi:glycosyltransferase involved in cell wall biosynthesis
MTRLLYVVNIPRFFVTHRLPLARAARARGYDVHIATSAYDTEHVEIIKREGLPFHPLPLSQHGTNLAQELVAFQALYRLYRSLKPDIVHHVTIKPVIYGGLAARMAGIPAVVFALAGLGYVFVASGTKARLIRAAASLALRPALSHPNSRLIFQNPDDRQMFVQSHLIASERTILIKGSGVDTTRFTPQPEPDGIPVALFAGRMLWKKGVGDFVEAAKRLRSAGVPTRFVVVGYPEPSSPEAVPMSQLDDWQREGLIEWWGKRTDMPDVFAQSHVVCLPSTYGEGVPMVLIEAAACGRAIVTTDTPGCREITHDGENGLLVPGGDTEALAQAIRCLAEDPARRRQMGERGRALVEAEFSLDRVLSETFAVYDGLL